MARKKRKPSEATEVESNLAVPTEQVSATPVAEMTAASADEPVAPAGEGVTPSEPQKQWGEPYRAIFTSTSRGFEMGENRRFKQRVFKFHERPEQSVIDQLKDNGFTYRPAEKSWTIHANPDSRRLSEELAHQFAGEQPAMFR